MVIEIDGPVHKKQVEYDKFRENEIMLRDVTVIRFSNDEIELNLETVLMQIEHKITTILDFDKQNNPI